MGGSKLLITFGNRFSGIIQNKLFVGILIEFTIQDHYQWVQVAVTVCGVEVEPVACFKIGYLVEHDLAASGSSVEPLNGAESDGIRSPVAQLMPGVCPAIGLDVNRLAIDGNIDRLIMEAFHDPATIVEQAEDGAGRALKATIEWLKTRLSGTR